MGNDWSSARPAAERWSVMPPERSQLARWFVRNWFLVLVVSFAMALGLTQIWLERAFHPPFLVLVATGSIFVAALFGFAYAVLRLGQPLSDLRYRWLTRRIDRLMRQTNREAKRPPVKPNAGRCRVEHFGKLRAGRRRAGPSNLVC